MPLLIPVVLIAVVNLWATRRVLRAETDATKRGLQLALVWLVPVVGAALVFAAHRTTAEPAKDIDYTPRTELTDGVLGPHGPPD